MVAKKTNSSNPKQKKEAATIPKKKNTEPKKVSENKKQYKKENHKAVSENQKKEQDFSFNELSIEINGFFKILYATIIRKYKEGSKDFNFVIFVRQLFLSNLKIKILSVLISFSIFGYVKMQDIDEKVVVVKLEVSKNEDLAFVVSPPENITVFISGTRTALEEIDINQITSKIDLTDIVEEGVYERTPLIEGLNPSVQIINYTPKTVSVELSSLEKKLLPIEPELVGKPHPDFEIKNFKTSPRKIWVFGPKEILEDITKLVTEPIDVEGIQVGKETEVQLNRNIHPSLRVDLNRKIKVNVSIVSKYYEESLKESFSLTVDLPVSSGLTWREYVLVSNVEYRIPVEDSENFDPEQQINFYVDTTKIVSPGEYVLPIKYEKVEGLRLKNYSPKKATIIIEEGNVYTGDSSVNSSLSDEVEEEIPAEELNSIPNNE